MTILSIIGVIIWSIFFQGFNFSQKSMSKNTIHQESNLVITNLTRIHQTSNEYEISMSSCKIIVIATKQDTTTKTYEFEHPRLCFSINQVGIFDPSTQDVDIKLTIYERIEPSNVVDVDTILYRLKDGGY